jgi:hypothetical protein
MVLSEMSKTFDGPELAYDARTLGEIDSESIQVSQLEPMLSSGSSAVAKHSFSLAFHAHLSDSGEG